MKKLLAGMAAAVMTLGLVGCGFQLESVYGKEYVLYKVFRENEEVEVDEHPDSLIIVSDTIIQRKHTSHKLVDGQLEFTGYVTTDSTYSKIDTNMYQFNEGFNETFSINMEYINLYETINSINYRKIYKAK